MKEALLFGGLFLVGLVAERLVGAFTRAGERINQIVAERDDGKEE